MGGRTHSPWVSGYSTIYDTGIDDSVFVLEECVLTSLTSEDDPAWEKASAGTHKGGTMRLMANMIT